jgi:hypothetical protein
MKPTTRFLATAENCTFPTQIGKVIFTTVDRNMRDLTWRNATGFSFWFWGRQRYVPAFFWRKR